MKKKSTLMMAVALLMLSVMSLEVKANEGDELAICQGTGSGYGTRRTLTDTHEVNWVLSTGQSGYLGTNSSTNHGNVKPTADDIPVVKAVNKYTYTTTTGYYFYYTTTPVANVGSIEFSYTGNSGNQEATAYVVVGDALAASGGNAYTQIELAENSTSTQGVSLGTNGTFTFTFAETQMTARYYGFIIKTNSYKRLTAGTIKLLEGNTGAPNTYTVTYDSNGATSGSVPTDNNSYTDNDEVTVLDNSGNLEKTFYTFNGWNTAADGTGTSYTANSTFIITQNTTLYAQWQPTLSVATYTISSKYAVDVVGAPTNSTASYNTTYNSAYQLTNGNSMTLTLGEYKGYIIKGLVLSMKSNGSSGAGYLSVMAGEASIASIGSSTAGVAFNNSQWNGAYTTSYVDVNITLSNDSYAIQNNEDVVIVLGATTNSLYCQSYTIFYEEAPSLTKTINAYSGDGGYYLIASPFASVTPSADNGFLTSTYDLYKFDQSATNAEWQNYEASNFNLESGKGYLYASSTTTTLTFSGTPYSGTGEVELTYVDGATFAGWNLIGNPFATTAYLANRTFYVMNEEGGTEIKAATLNSAIAAMQGVFVIADDANDNSVTFTTTAPAKGSSIALNISQNRGSVIDRAIVNFGESTLPKFMLNPDNTKVYIPQDGKHFAVAQSESNQGRMPVNFKAAKNGNYTITVDVENVEASYLHLVDNLTGADIDLLANPSYSFDANTSDFEARFALVYNTNAEVSENTDDSFAYFNGSEWVIDNSENATVQVIDMLGRVVMSANNAQSISTDNIASGVYVIRLTNGSDVKAQKIVVE